MYQKYYGWLLWISIHMIFLIRTCICLGESRSALSVGKFMVRAHSVASVPLITMRCVHQGLDIAWRCLTYCLFFFFFSWEYFGVVHPILYQWELHVQTSKHFDDLSWFPYFALKSFYLFLLLFYVYETVALLGEKWETNNKNGFLLCLSQVQVIPSNFIVLIFSWFLFR